MYLFSRMFPKLVLKMILIPTMKKNQMMSKGLAHILMKRELIRNQSQVEIKIN